MPAIVLQQVSSSFARENADKTLEKAFALKWVTKHLAGSPMADRLTNIFPTGAVHAWGAKAERRHQFNKMSSNESLVLFRRHKHVYAYGVIVATLESEALGLSLWGRDTDGETWPLIFLLRKFKRIEPPTLAAELNPTLGHAANDNWQGLVAIEVPMDDNLAPFFAREIGEA